MVRLNGSKYKENNRNTPYIKAENWRLDMPEISVFPASIYSTSRISG